MMRQGIGRIEAGLVESREARSGEQRLWESVLVRYARDLAVERYAMDARAWFASEDDDVGAFVYVCQHIGFEPSAVRRALACGCALGKLDGSRRPDIHRLKLIGRNAGAPQRVREQGCHCRHGQHYQSARCLRAVG